MPELVKYIVDEMESLPQRAGEQPQTSSAMPHQQLSQNAPKPIQETLFERTRSLPGVSTGPSNVSVPGARAFFVDLALAKGPADAFMVGQEFAHLHPEYDGSLHLMLPSEAAERVVGKGWGEPHLIAKRIGTQASTDIMVYGPRDEFEMGVVWLILRAAYAFATGDVPSEV